MSIRSVDSQQAVQAYTARQKPASQEPPAAQVDTFQSSNVDPNETGLDVLKAASATFRLPLDQTYQATKSFIAAHPFFHHGLMDLPIGDGKHFRNVPFIGPYHVVAGLLTGNETDVAKGCEVTRGTWDAA